MFCIEIHTPIIFLRVYRTKGKKLEINYMERVQFCSTCFVFFPFLRALEWWQRKTKREIRDWEGRQIEISSAAKTLALCTQLVWQTAQCTGSWIHCTHAHVVVTPAEYIQLNKELHRHSLLLPASLSPSLSLLFSLGCSLTHINREWESERETKPSYRTHLHSISVWVGSRWIRQNTKWPTYTLRRDK